MIVNKTNNKLKVFLLMGAASSIFMCIMTSYFGLKFVSDGAYTHEAGRKFIQTNPSETELKEEILFLCVTLDVIRNRTGLFLIITSLYSFFNIFLCFCCVKEPLSKTQTETARDANQPTGSVLEN
ncbi:MAG: hypothetical protein HC904_13200 [Blastochloris sp.]|nr:hypothetical protein [Blastochloris sp.]